MLRNEMILSCLFINRIGGVHLHQFDLKKTIGIGIFSDRNLFNRIFISEVKSFPFYLFHVLSWDKSIAAINLKLENIFIGIS